MPVIYDKATTALTFNREDPGERRLALALMLLMNADGQRSLTDNRERISGIVPYAFTAQEYAEAAALCCGNKWCSTVLPAGTSLVALEMLFEGSIVKPMLEYPDRCILSLQKEGKEYLTQMGR